MGEGRKEGGTVQKYSNTLKTKAIKMGKSSEKYAFGIYFLAEPLSVPLAKAENM